MTTKVLFLPVSGGKGCGEYYRSLTLAQSIRSAREGIQIDFGLYKGAAFTANCPFNTILLPASATKSVSELVPVIESGQYSAVVFDCAGRTELLKVAKRTGAKTIYISSRPSARRKGFKPQWQRFLDQHWSVQPKYLVDSMSGGERFISRLFGGPKINHLGTIYAQGTPQPTKKASDKQQVLIALGARVSTVYGVDFFVNLVNELSPLIERFQIHVNLVLGAEINIPIEESASNITVSTVLPPSEFIGLMQQSSVVVTNGGSSLSQAVELGKPVVSCPMGKDQALRIEETVNMGYAIAAEPEPKALASKLQEVLANTAALKTYPASKRAPLELAIEKLLAAIESR